MGSFHNVQTVKKAMSEHMVNVTFTADVKTCRSATFIKSCGLFNQFLP